MGRRATPDPMAEVLAAAEQIDPNTLPKKLDTLPYAPLLELVEEFVARKMAGTMPAGLRWLMDEGFLLLNEKREAQGLPPVPKITRETVRKYVNERWPEARKHFQGRGN